MSEVPHSLNLGVHSSHVFSLSTLTGERTRIEMSERPNQIEDSLVMPVTHTCSIKEALGQACLDLAVAGHFSC